MIATPDKHQMCTERRGGGNPVAASRARHAPAARKAQDTRRITPLRRVGSHTSVAPMTRGFIVVPPFTRPGLRARPFLRVGWCFNTARDLIEFDALTKSGIHPLHAIAAMSPVLPADKTNTVEPGLTQPVVQPPHHSERLSKIVVAMTNRDTKERPKSWKRQPTRTAP